jgi:hypothetical protein
MYGPMISDIDVVVTTFTGRVKFLVKVGQEPTTEDYDWSSYDGNLLIR